MLRLLARTVHVLWRDRPADALAIHPHHIDPAFGPIRNEITPRLGQGEYTPALKADAAATWKVHQAMATLRGAEITCHFEADIKLEGVNSFQIDFDGRLDKANTVKSFLDPSFGPPSITTSRAPILWCSRPRFSRPWTIPTPSRRT